MRPTPITDLQMIPYLIRDLYSPAQMSVMMGNPPVTIADFWIELRRLEAITTVPTASLTSPVVPSNSISTPSPPSSSMDSICRALEVLTSQVSALVQGMIRPPFRSLPEYHNLLSSRSECFDDPQDPELKYSVITVMALDTCPVIVLIRILVIQKPEPRKTSKPVQGRL